MTPFVKNCYLEVEKLRKKDPFIDSLYNDPTMENRKILINTLATRFCNAIDNNDEIGKTQCFGALYLQFQKTMLSFLAKVRVEGNIDYDDLPSIFYERLMYACKYRYWMNPDKKLNAQQCINQCISTEVANVFGRSNWQCNKTNVSAHKVSIHNSLGGGDDDKTIEDTIADPNSKNSSGFSAEDVVKDYFRMGMPDQAIIIDAICFSVDSTRVVNGYIETCDLRIKKFLAKLTEKDANYYEEKYNASVNVIIDAIHRLSSYNSKQLQRALDNTRISLREGLL